MKTMSTNRISDKIKVDNNRVYLLCWAVKEKEPVANLIN